jgi:hypothetical protein
LFGHRRIVAEIVGPIGIVGIERPHRHP